MMLDSSLKPGGLRTMREPAPCEDTVEIARRLARDAAWWRGMSSAGERSWQLLAESESFEAWAIAWPPGEAIELHDHGNSAAAVVVTLGELTETKVLHRDGAFRSWSRSVEAGKSFTVAPYELHDVANLSTSPAMSVHVYSPRLSTMTYYEIEDGRLIETRRLEASSSELVLTASGPLELVLAGSGTR